MSILIKNGEVVTAEARFKTDVLCEDGTITKIAANIDPRPDTELIDASGKLVFPGFIDPHCHAYLPLGDIQTSDDYTSTSIAAVVGGTTCFIDFATAYRDDTPLGGFEKWMNASEGRSACDYTFHLALSQYNETVEKEARKVVEEGVASFKVYLAYNASVGIEDDQLNPILKLAKDCGVIVCCHCENDALISERQKRLLAEGKTGPEWHHESRPPFVEADGSRHFAAALEATGAHGYNVHLSCREALEEAVAAQKRGVNLWIETVIQFLTLDNSLTKLPDFEGAKYIMSPPLREKEHQDVLWKALANRTISTVGTDHAPFHFKGQKERGRGDFTKIPGGLGSAEHRVDLLWTYGVKEGRIDEQTLVDCASTQPAKIFGLYPGKGTIAVGSDADIVIYDPDYEGVISAATHHMNIDYSCYEGTPVKGRPHVVLVRGQVAAKDGEFVGSIGRGKFVPRESTHF
ncbi:MAG: dihydropyrimidinase [Verrucomicrobia bacterium]|nr:dihydropyrimidinase [Verrucomicrobiota bacterium]